MPAIYSLNLIRGVSAQVIVTEVIGIAAVIHLAGREVGNEMTRGGFPKAAYIRVTGKFVFSPVHDGGIGILRWPRWMKCLDHARVPGRYRLLGRAYHEWPRVRGRLVARRTFRSSPAAPTTRRPPPILNR